MITRYKYTVDDTVLQVFSVATKQQRQKLLRIFDQLTDNPFLHGDSIQQDDVGRPLQVKRFGEWVVTFWPEHLGNQIHIVALEHLRL